MVLLLGIHFATPGSAEEVNVQVTSFQVPELTLGLATLGLPPEQDAALHEKLSRGAASGEIEIVLDHHVSLPSGGPQVSKAVSTYRYPTEYEPGRSGFLLCPTAFETRDLGTTLEVAATADRGDFSGLDWRERPTRIIDVNLTAGRVRPNGLRPLRIPNTLWSGLASGTQLLPSFLSEETKAALTVFSDQPVFVSLTRPAAIGLERPGGNEQQVIVTFARATATPNAAPVRPEDDLYTPTTPLRLHWLTLRVPRVAASAAVWDHPTVTAEAMLNEWLALVHDGQAVLLSHAAVATRSGNRAEVAGITEIPFARDFEASLLPFGYVTRHTGATWNVEPTLGADGTIIDVTISLDETSLPIWGSVPVRSGSASKAVELPDFLSLTIGTSLTTRLGETRVIGAVTPMADQVPMGEEADWVDVSFIRAAPPPRRLAKPQTSSLDPNRQLVASIAIFSVEESQAHALATVTESGAQDAESITLAVGELWDAAAEGELWLTGFASLSHRSGTSNRIRAVREWATLAAASIKPNDTPPMASLSMKSVDSGMIWGVQCIQDREDGGQIELECVYDVAPPAPRIEEPGPAGANETEPPTPAFNTFTHSLRVETRYESGHPQILSIEESPAPPGHPEHGRWLVTVLKVVSGT